MANQAQVLACWREHPDWNSTLIADEIGCMPEYVRVTLNRNGISLVRRHGENSIYALGRAAKRAGLTIADIERLSAHA